MTSLFFFPNITSPFQEEFELALSVILQCYLAKLIAQRLWHVYLKLLVLNGFSLFICYYCSQFELISGKQQEWMGGGRQGFCGLHVLVHLFILLFILPTFVETPALYLTRTSFIDGVLVSQGCLA